MLVELLMRPNAEAALAEQVAATGVLTIVDGPLRQVLQMLAVRVPKSGHRFAEGNGFRCDRHALFLLVRLSPGPIRRFR